MFITVVLLLNLETTPANKFSKHSLCLFIYLFIFCRYTMVPASLYLGFAASIIWVGEV